MTSGLIAKLFITFFSVRLITKLYLSFRNTNYVKKHGQKVPNSFQEKISLEEHKKAASYTITKTNFGQMTLIFNSVILLFWLFGGLGVLDQYIRSLELSALSSGLAFFGLFSLIGLIIELPFSLYSTFVIEEKFGFNKMNLKLFFSDLLKQILLGAIIGVPLLAVILYIMEKLENNWWLWAWAIMTAFQLLMVYIFPTYIAPLFNKFSPLEDESLKQRIEQLCKRTGFTLTGLFVMDASKRSGHGNAYFTGFGSSKRIVFFDTLLSTLEPEETEAVLAHELGHFKKKHILKSMILSFVFSFIGFYILGRLYDYLPFYLAHKVSTPSSYMALVLFSMVAPIYTFFTTPLMSYFSRKNEFEADEFAATHSDAKKLISALVKLYKDNASTLTPDPIFSAFYHSHPPALVRVQFLEGLKDKRKKT